MSRLPISSYLTGSRASGGPVLRDAMFRGAPGPGQKGFGGGGQFLGPSFDDPAKQQEWQDKYGKGFGGRGVVTNSLHIGTDKPWSETNPTGFGGPGGTGGTGGTGSYSGSYGPGPGGYTGTPSEQLQQSQDAANAANEARYGHGLSIYDQMLGMTGGMGKAQSEMIGRRNEAGKAGDLQGMISSGIANTTVRQQHERARDLDANLSRNDLQDRLTQQKLGILSGKAGFIERRTDAQPDLGLISGLIEGANADPFGGTGGTGGTGGSLPYSRGGSTGGTGRLPTGGSTWNNPTGGIPTNDGFGGLFAAQASQRYYASMGIKGTMQTKNGQTTFIPTIIGGVSVKNPAAQDKPWDWAGQYGQDSGGSSKPTPLETQIQDEIRRRGQEAARKKYETQQKAQEEQQAQEAAQKRAADMEALGVKIGQAQERVYKLKGQQPDAINSPEHSSWEKALEDAERVVDNLYRQYDNL